MGRTPRLHRLAAGAGLASLSALYFLYPALKREAGWRLLAPDVRNYIQDVYQRGKYHWAALPPETRKLLLEDAERRAPERAALVRGVLEAYRRARTLRQLGFADYWARRSRVDTHSLLIWAPDGYALYDKAFFYRALRSNAASGLLGAYGIEEAPEFLTHEETVRLGTAISRYQAARGNSKTEPRAAAEVRAGLAGLFFDPRRSWVPEPGPAPNPARMGALLALYYLRSPQWGRRGTAFLRRTLRLLSRSAEGRRLLRDAARKYSAGGGVTLCLGCADFPSSDVTELEGFDQGRLIGLNPEFLSQGRAGLDEAACVLAHELQHARSEIVSPDSFEGEQQAFLEQMLVALELFTLGEGPARILEGAHDLSLDPSGAWSKLEGDFYPDHVDSFEAPVADLLLAQRVEDVSDESDELRQEFRRDVQRRLWWIGHLEHQHGVEGLEAVHDELDAAFSEDQNDLEALEKEKSRLQSRIAFYRGFNDPAGRRRAFHILALVDSAPDPGLFAPIPGLEARVERDLFFAPLTPGPASPGGPSAEEGAREPKGGRQLSAEQLDDAIEWDQRENGHRAPF